MLWNLLIKFINSIIKSIGSVLTFIFSILPDSPFQKYIIQNETILPYLKMVNYFIPISEMLVTFEAVLVCVGIYYIYQIVARWIKLIE